MDFYGNINLLNNEIQQAVMETEVNLPETPKAGRLIFKNKRVLICVEIIEGLPVWVPLTNELNTYVHDQASGSTTWTINHGLNTITPVITVYDANQNPVIFDDWTPVDNNSGTITFANSMTGRAVLMFGSATGGATATPVAYTHTQTTVSNTWVIPHNLGYNPIVRVFVGNQEVQPSSITHDSITQTTITFSQPYVGTARLL